MDNSGAPVLFPFSISTRSESSRRDPRLMAGPGFDPSTAAWLVSREFLTGYVVEKSLSVDNILHFRDGLRLPRDAVQESASRIN